MKIICFEYVDENLKYCTKCIRFLSFYLETLVLYVVCHMSTIMDDFLITMYLNTEVGSLFTKNFCLLFALFGMFGVFGKEFHSFGSKNASLMMTYV